MDNGQTLCNIIEFLINNPTVDCVTWKDIKIYEQNKVWYADYEYVVYGDWREDEEDYINLESISMTLDINKFKNDILDWVGKHEN